MILRESSARYSATRIISEARCEILVSEPNIIPHKTFNIINYDEAYSKADIITWLVKYKEFHNIQVDKLKNEFDFCGVRK